MQQAQPFGRYLHLLHPRINLALRNLGSEIPCSTELFWAGLGRTRKLFNQRATKRTTNATSARMQQAHERNKHTNATRARMQQAHECNNRNDAIII